MIGNSKIQGVSDPHARDDGVASMSAQITSRLRNSIVFAELAPGTRLKQDDLALRFGASRVPLREAMRQLTAEGLIDWPSNRSAVVKTLALEEIEELFELGRLLEARATRLGTPHLDDDDIADLRRLEVGMRDPDLSLPDWYQANLAFHMIPMSRSGQKRTMEIVAATRRNLTRYFLTPALYERVDGDWRDKHAEEHRGLLDALESRDQDTAGKLIEHHWHSTWKDWKRHLAAGNRGKPS